MLSSEAGAAEQLTDALLVNPKNVDEIVLALNQALGMPLSEKRMRWDELRDGVRKEMSINGQRILSRS